MSRRTPQHQGHRQGEGAHVRHRLGQLHPQLPPDMGQGQHRRDEEQPLPGYRQHRGLPNLVDGLGQHAGDDDDAAQREGQALQPQGRARRR